MSKHQHAKKKAPRRKAQASAPCQRPQGTTLKRPNTQQHKRAAASLVSTLGARTLDALLDATAADLQEAGILRKDAKARAKQPNQQPQLQPQPHPMQQQSAQAPQAAAAPCQPPPAQQQHGDPQPQPDLMSLLGSWSMRGKAAEGAAGGQQAVDVAQEQQEQPLQAAQRVERCEPAASC
jgi:hypothetical protein